ncbi:outer membrane lipoprotein carrier protein LolA [Lacinutrix sp. C3R15]|uniref:LolA family protein n=1 Tax=Flavobacteriaceae TaxID=49546 RepID=UPI001C093653|nr:MULTISPECIES: outer membrane lipoprotein carrier protein LolA [Flavobacteriaceae]MBU2940545.1 outer membrane lipoprotein carrier protein LolA [Lacinutrix sp. C3R15]MDO6623865.1 outer membrane lipoprotein carrier protein LolA [Oceanihabitans sp. 1_MG-2023]
MKKLIFLFTILLSISSVAQEDAKTLLDEVSQKVKSYNNITIDFKYMLHNTAENIKQETRGDVVMQGEKFKLNILGITRIYDGKTLYSISPEDEQVTISSESMEDEGSITPSKMLSFYEEGFTYKMDITQNVQGRKIQYVQLIPIDSNSEIKSVLLGIDAQTKHIYNLIETGKNGTKTTLTVNSFQTNETLSKSLFTFDKSKFKDYYIEKLD